MMPDRLGHVLINSRCTSCEVRPASDTGRAGAPHPRSELGPLADMATARLLEVNRILVLPNRSVAGDFHQVVERPGIGRATVRDAGETALKRPPLSRNQPGWRCVRSARRWFPAGTPPPPSGVRSHNVASAGRRAW